MMQFTLDLDSNSQRPVVLLKNFYNISGYLIQVPIFQYGQMMKKY